MKNWRYWLLIVPVILIIGVAVSPVWALWVGIPGEIRLFPGTEFSLSIQLPFRLTDTNGLDVTGPKGIFSITPEQPGKQYFAVKLFGIIPVREMVVDVIPEVKVFPGGQSIGVMVNPVGLVVSRIVPVRGIDGNQYYPAKEAGIQPGDLVVSIGSRRVNRPEQVGQFINELAKESHSVPIVLSRGGRLVNTLIIPVLSLQEDLQGNQQEIYLIGIFLDDPASGVGTLTFHDVSGRYGALGHTVTDGLGRSVDIIDGSIVNANIERITSGLKGMPGEKLGVLDTDQIVVGNIDKNTKFGIFGDLNQQLINPYFPNPIPIALTHEVKPGPAKIYTVLEGYRISEFDAEITKVTSQSMPDDKGLIIRITDSNLLAKTGGIIQGMSGSPIVQKGKLVGAITHVFVNDPRIGYGSFIEWMIYEAGLEPMEKSMNPIVA